MGFQSGINLMIGMAGAGIGLVRGLGKQAQASEKAKTNLVDEVKSKQTGTKLTTKDTIQEFLREATSNNLSNEQYNQLAQAMNKRQRREYKEKYIGDMSDGNKQ